MTEAAFYDYLEGELIKEMTAATGRPFEARQIKPGLHYVKRQQKAKGQIEITVNAYQRGEVYRVTSKTPLDTVTVTYTTEAQGAQTEVTMTEEIASFKPDAHGRLVRGFASALLLGRMADAVMKMETAIQAATEKGTD